MSHEEDSQRGRKHSFIYILRAGGGKGKGDSKRRQGRKYKESQAAKRRASRNGEGMPLRDKYRTGGIDVPKRSDSGPPRAGLQSWQYRILQGLGYIGPDKRLDV